MHSRLSFFPAVLAVLLAGCLPYSCNRTESRALLPADSLSRVMSAALPVDTLEVVPLPALPEMAYPRTVAFGPDGRLWASDTGAHQLVYVTPAMEAGALALDSLQYPYLAGFRAGSPVVFSPDAGRIASLDGSLSVPMPGERPPRLLQYAAVSDSSIWIKLAGREFAGYLAQLDEQGRELVRHPLPDPFWRWAGALRVRDHQPVSLSGYRPQYYFFDNGLDSLALQGFDSPMLPRSRTFLMGITSQPPLLTSAGAFLGDMLYAVNVRPGWLRVEVYDGDGRLARVLVEPNPAFGKEFYPTDIAVWPEPDGGVLIAVTLTEPQPTIRLYRTPAG